MSLKLISIMFFLAVGSYGAAVPKCHLETLDACGQPLKEFRKEIGQKFPTNDEQVNKLCTKLDEASACMDNFKKQCMTPMQLQIVSFLTEGASDVYKKFCSSGSDVRADYLEHAECINDAYSSDEFKGLAEYIEAGLETLSEKPNNEKLTTACCGYQYMEMNMNKLGKDKCGEEAVESFQRVSRMAVSSLPEVFCNGFDPEDAICKKALPAPGTKPTGSLKNSHIAKTFSAVYLDE